MVVKRKIFVLNTKPSVSGHGFKIYWQYGQGLFVEILRTDAVMEQMVVGTTDYPSWNSFGVWYHYAISYKYDGSNPSNIFELYLDGTLLTDLDKSTATASGVSIPDPNTGIMVLSKGDTSGTGGDDSNMKLDEIVFWEHLLACDDITCTRLHKG